jgi:hypothetical protein
VFNGQDWPIISYLIDEEVYVFDDLEAGKTYHIETHGKYYVGELDRVTPTCLYLKKAAWVSATGYLSDYFSTGRADGLDVEIYPPETTVRVPVAYVSDIVDWPHGPFTKNVGR